MPHRSIVNGLSGYQLYRKIGYIYDSFVIHTIINSGVHSHVGTICHHFSFPSFSSLAPFSFSLFQSLSHSSVCMGREVDQWQRSSREWSVVGRSGDSSQEGGDGADGGGQRDEQAVATTVITTMTHVAEQRQWQQQWTGSLPRHRRLRAPESCSSAAPRRRTTWRRKVREREGITAAAFPAPAHHHLRQQTVVFLSTKKKSKLSWLSCARHSSPTCMFPK